MPQSQLKRTEFLNDFLARDGLYWGVNLCAWRGDRNIGDMRIWRDERRENFTSEDLELLDLVRPPWSRRCIAAAATRGYLTWSPVRAASDRKHC